jgi:predicted ATPase
MSVIAGERRIVSVLIADIAGSTPIAEKLGPERYKFLFDELVRLPSTLSELQWLELVVEERGGAAPEYRFRHGLVQEVAYGTLVEARRRELHRAVAEALEAMSRESPEEVWGLLAHHFTEAGDSDRAVE